MGLEIVNICLKISLTSLERGETPIAFCSLLGESLQFDLCFRAFFNHFATITFYKVKFAYTSSTGREARIRIFRCLDF